MVDVVVGVIHSVICVVVGVVGRVMGVIHSVICVVVGVVGRVMVVGDGCNT